HLRHPPGPRPAHPRHLLARRAARSPGRGAIHHRPAGRLRGIRRRRPRLPPRHQGSRSPHNPRSRAPARCVTTEEPYRDDVTDPLALRLEADHIALEDHTSTSAQHAHRIIATHLWTMLRNLGFTEGRVLAVGDDAATFIELPHTDGYSSLSVVADITDAHTPGTQFPVQLRLPKAHDRFDVVIASLPYNDVRLQDPGHVVVRRAVQAQLALTLHTLTRPGGCTILLASHDLMDQPFPEARRHLHPAAALLSAVRL